MGRVSYVLHKSCTGLAHIRQGLPDGWCFRSCTQNLAAGSIRRSQDHGTVPNGGVDWEAMASISLDEQRLTWIILTTVSGYFVLVLSRASTQGLI